MINFRTNFRMRFSAFLWKVRARLWSHRWVYSLYIWLWSRMRPNIAGRVITADTDIVIEGFPRSANTFTVHAFLSAQKKPVRVAHHLHDAYQVSEAVRQNIPCMVLLRDPVDAVVSWLLKSPQLRAEDSMRLYIDFYRAVEKHLDGVLVVRYEDVIHDLGSVIININERFSVQFDTFVHSTANSEKIFDIISTKQASRRELSGQEDELAVSKPTQRKQGAKAELTSYVEKECGDLIPIARSLRKRLLDQRTT